MTKQILVASEAQNDLLNKLNFEELENIFETKTYFICEELDCVRELADEAAVVLYFDCFHTNLRDTEKAMSKQWRTPPVVHIKEKEGKVIASYDGLESKECEPEELATAIRECLDAWKKHRRKVDKLIIWIMSIMFLIGIGLNIAHTVGAIPSPTQVLSQLEDK